MGFVVGPAVSAATKDTQADIGRHLTSSAHRFFRPVGAATILLGIAAGIHYGPLTSVEAFLGTLYGRTFLVALALALATWLYGENVTSKRAGEISKSAPEERPIAVRKTVQAVLVEQVGFFAVFVCMMLLRIHM